MHAGRTNDGRFGHFFRGIIRRSTDVKHAANLTNIGLLLLRPEQRVSYFSSRAKKADAFLKVRCSAVNGLPMPQPPDF